MYSTYAPVCCQKVVQLLPLHNPPQLIHSCTPTTHVHAPVRCQQLVQLLPLHLRQRGGQPRHGGRCLAQRNLRR